MLVPEGCDDGHDYCSGGSVTQDCPWNDMAACATQFDNWLKAVIGEELQERGLGRQHLRRFQVGRRGKYRRRGD